MKCERCQNEASFFYNEAINGKTRSQALCTECAAKAGFFTGTAAKSLENDLYSVLFQGKHAATAKVCPTCGKAWSAIATHGTVGCADCYKAFREELSVSIRRMHGSAVHVGRTPVKQRENAEKEHRVTTLRAALKAAVAAENFEEAARLRDEIRAAESL